MFLARQRCKQVLEDELESVLCLGGAKRSRGRLFSQDQRDLGDHFGQNPAVVSQRLEEARAPEDQPFLAFGKQLLDKRPECLNKRAKWGVAHDLVEFSGNEEAFLDRKSVV